MNKKVLLIAAVIVVMIGAGILFLLVNPADAPSVTSSKSDQTVVATEPTQPSTTVASSQPGTYVDYSAAALAEANGSKVLFFHAPWCPQCRALEADIKANTVPEGVTIFKVDYDTSQDLRKKYGVTIQTTVVLVDDQDNLVKKFVAYDDPSLAAIQENLL